MIKQAFYEMRFAFAGYAIGFGLSALLSSKITTGYLIGEVAIGVVIFIIGLLVAKYSPSR